MVKLVYMLLEREMCFPTVDLRVDWRFLTVTADCGRFGAVSEANQHSV